MKKRIILFDEDLTYGSIVDQSIMALDAFIYLGWYQKAGRLIHKLKRTKPDFLLMELPTGPDAPLLDEIRKNWGYINIVVISSKEDYVSIRQALRCGANGYFLKYLGNDEIKADLNKLAQDGVALSPLVARNLVRGFWKTNNSPLTRTETKVLKFISLGHTYSSLAKNLEISKGTAKTHLKNIYRKLNIHRKSEALKRAHAEQLIN